MVHMATHYRHAGVGPDGQAKQISTNTDQRQQAGWTADGTTHTDCME